MRRIALIAVATFASATRAEVFVFTGYGSGTLNGVPFDAAAFTFTAHGDPSTRYLGNGNSYNIDHTYASMSIAGLGSILFYSPTRTFVNNSVNLVGFSHVESYGGADLFWGPANTAFHTWDMLSSIGPISGTCRVLQWHISPPISTDHGILVFDDLDAVAGSFQSTVPSPSLLTAAFGVTVAACARRHGRP